MEHFMEDICSPWSVAFQLTGQALNYLADSARRSVLFADILRERGNVYLEHLRDGQPPVLVYDYEIIMDGKDRDRPCNYKLARIVEPEGVVTDPKRRPVIIIDPRAGHGPGIGGSKRDSEIGMALKAGHPVYFVLFETDPVPGQTIADVEQAEIAFIEEVVRRHPDSLKPAVIGNCQAGWALILLSADRPGTTGPIILNGSPLSYWAGIEGKDTMRYLGGLCGGIWVNALLSDLGGGTFDGANLVMNFEMLNWANTFWSKQYHVYANADTERERFLQFERWWNAYFHMSKEEIVFILNNLFIGNKLEKGGVRLNGDKMLDLRDIKDPIVVFCSDGDNITPPQQALNWIYHVWGSTGEIKRRQQVIVYVRHKNIGHLGIFVSGKIAQKEHREIMGSYDMIEYLPPGIYEMLIENAPEENASPYLVSFEERRLEDILVLNDQFTEEEENFPLVSAVSDRNYRFYEEYVSPFVKAVVTPFTAEMYRQLHPMRISRYFLSDLNFFLFPVKCMAAEIRDTDRKYSDADSPFRGIEKAVSDYIAGNLDACNLMWARTGESVFKRIYDRYSPSYSFFPELKEKQTGIKEMIELRKSRRIFKKLDRARWMRSMTEGGFKEGLIRILLAVGTADGVLSRNEFENFQEVIRNHPQLKDITATEYRKTAREQARILQTDKYWAVRSLGQLLPTADDREYAVRICHEVFQDEETTEEIREMFDLSSGKNLTECLKGDVLN